MERLLEGKLTFTPMETDEGKRYLVEGRLSLGEFLQIPAAPAAPYLKRPQADSNSRPQTHRRRFSRILMGCKSHRASDT